MEARYTSMVRANMARRHQTSRNRFVSHALLPEIFNNSKLLLYIHENKSNFLKNVVVKKLEDYERILRLRKEFRPPQEVTVPSSLIFAFSCATTIGYSHVYPMTQAGRLFSIFLTIVGVPFTMIVINDLAYLIDYRLANSNRLLGIPVTLASLALIGWLALGCALAANIYTREPLSNLLYFVISTLATVGHAQFVLPADSPTLLASWAVFTLLGLALVSLFVNLMHTKFASAYWIPGRMMRTAPNGQCPRCLHLATFDSFEELEGSEPSLNHLTTLGIFQTEDKCRLINFERAEKACVDAIVQTEDRNGNQEPEPHLIGSIYEEPRVYLAAGRNGISKDDVHSLLAETYASQPPRLIF
ncbi:unnamed protein product, partial [Mesorhabditis spiculigera]